MRDLYKAIDNLSNIIAEEDSLNEKIDLKTGKYLGTNITPTKLQLARMKKRGDIPMDYKLPPQKLSKTNPSAKGFINFLNNLGKKVSDKGKELDPFYKEPKQNNKVDKKEPSKVVKKEPSKVVKKVLPKLKQTQPDALDKIQGSNKVKATASNTKNYDRTLALQKSLIARGAKIKADGIMGPNTKAAMQKFMKPSAMPTPRPTPKSGGSDSKFVTGPELDLPKMAPKVAKNNQINSPGALGGKVKPKIDPRMPDLNRYAQNKDGTYAPTTPNLQPNKKDNISVIGNPLRGLGKLVPDAVKNYKFGDMQKGFDKFVGNLKKDPIYKAAGDKNRKLYGPKTDKKIASKESKQPTKTMIEQITGKKTCL